MKNDIFYCPEKGQLKLYFVTHKNAPRWLLKHACPCACAHALTRDIEASIQKLPLIFCVKLAFRQYFHILLGALQQCAKTLLSFYRCRQVDTGT